MRLTKFRITLVIAVGLSAVLLGVIVYAQATNILAVGTIPNSELFDSPATVTVRTLTINPNTSLAWHYHPGYAFSVVKSGTLTVEDGCGGEETLLPGDAFEELDGRVHRAKNLSLTEPTLIYNTFVVPQGKPTTRNIAGNERRCGPPRDVNECMDGGWANFTQPRSFNEQGDCIQFVRHRPQIALPVPEDPQN